MIEFGTGGWRAVIGDGFTRQNIQLLAKAMSMKMKREGVEDQGIVIGYDRRFLSKEAVKWACEVFVAEGIRCLFVNRSSPTPLVMFYVEKHKLPYGMMVTASHNPAIYNGFKVFTYGGRDASAEQTQEIEAYARSVKQEEIRWIEYEKAKASGLVEEFNPLNEYLDNIIDKIDMKAIRDRGLHVVLDPMYGVSQTAIKTILSTARCEIDLIHETHDTLFGRRMPAPSRESLTELCKYVTEMDCDLGIATDGDADRLGVVDDTGKYLHANDILVLLYYYLLKYKGWHGPAVRNVATTHLLDRIAESFGEKCYEVPVGFKYISAKMTQTGAIIGGESSGGMTVRGHINGKDGIYAASLLVEMIAVTGKKLSELMKEIEQQYGRCHVAELSRSFPSERREELKKLLYEDKLLPAFARPIERVSYLDGCKVYFKDGGWVIARFSGTEPLLRVFGEMEDEETAQQYCRDFFHFLGIDE
ncbi:MAG: phosphoglucomutase/phosphomannomutase family protein [Lachnospiraceae bacterium]|uniref:phosphoglucomutase/phosphomannomutase family protein n=1 Tax=Parablautia sp. Marseille-Q6255 TaxID=3039593 RepID=UPI0024BC1A21|nr:phosphoglucomutase/phosphomannomutase family protein [Parablautia sp. Marseille-Q6255]